MPERPKILLTCGRYDQGGPNGNGQAYYSGCSTRYSNAVLAAMGAPIIIPWMREAEVVEFMAGFADGIIFIGGGDISPLEYGQEVKPVNRNVDPVRDALELELAKVAIAKEIPILGICRGLQVLNVACGGSLIQDIATEVASPLQHEPEGTDSNCAHPIDIAPGCVLEVLLGHATQTVNSYHHQAIASIGKGLSVVATTRDGVIEAIESDGDSPLLAVQFHPEIESGGIAAFPELFSWIVERAAAYSAMKSALRSP